MKSKQIKKGKKDNRLVILGIIAAVVILGFVSLFFINKSQNESKISQSTTASNLETGEKAKNSSTNKVYGDYKPVYQATIDQLSDENYQNIILPKDLDKKIKSGEGTFVYFFSPTCLHCQKITPILMPAAEEMGVQIDQYNVLEFEQGWNTYNIEATPTLAYYEEGKEVDRIVGEASEEDFEEFFVNVKK